MKSKELTVGMYNPSTVKITNKQNHVEYESISGHVSEKEAREVAGNMYKGLYGHHYSGYYYDRKEALKRLNNELEEALQKVEELKWAISVTKKKTWKEVKGDR